MAKKSDISCPYCGAIVKHHENGIINVLDRDVQDNKLVEVCECYCKECPEGENGFDVEVHYKLTNKTVHYC